MRALAFLLVTLADVSLLAVLFGQVPGGDPLGGYGTLLIQLGALGLLAVVVVWIGPQMFKDAREERDKREAERAQRDKDAREERDKRDVRVEGLVSRMEAHFAERNAAIVARVGEILTLLHAVYGDRGQNRQPPG